jgi:hypothetical protein
LFGGDISVQTRRVYAKFTQKIAIFGRYDYLPARFGLVSFRKNNIGRMGVGVWASVVGRFDLAH